MEELLVTDIAGELGPDWLAGFNEEIQNQVVTEKAQYWVRQGAIAQREHSIGRQVLDGLGQKVASIDGKTFFRWMQQEGHDFWHDKNNVRGFLRDNPECKVPGYWNGLR
jgi:hypothetical protein